MARTEKKSLFTEISEEESATVSGGIVFSLLLDLSIPVAQSIQQLIQLTPPGVATDPLTVKGIEDDLLKAKSTS